MKKIILLLIICTAFTSFTTAPKNTFTIVGSWAEDKRTAPSFVFDSEGYAKVVLDGVLKGGKEFIYNGHKASITYTANLDVSPHELKIVMNTPDADTKETLTGIFTVVNENTITLSYTTDNRPNEFYQYELFSTTYKRVK
jgi:hypothetical protein